MDEAHYLENDSTQARVDTVSGEASLSFRKAKPRVRHGVIGRRRDERIEAGVESILEPIAFA